MKKRSKLLSYLLVFAFMAALFQPMNAYAKEKINLPAEGTSLDARSQNEVISDKQVFKGKERFYPYQELETPATVQGFEYQLKDNVEIMPEDSDYNLVPAPIDKESTTGNIDSLAVVPPTVTKEKTYKPGTNLMKFADDSFVPQKDKIYIDKNAQGSFKVIDDAKEAGGKVEAAVVNPGANEVFKGLYIPKQNIDLTKGNITELAEGVELADNSSSIRSLGAEEEYPLPAADESKTYHEFTIPGFTIYEYPEKEDKKAETPKGMEESSGPTPSPSPTPHPEDRDAKDNENSSSLSIKIRMQGGRIRIYEPSLVAELGWDGDFDLGFRSMKVESNIVLEGNITFSKEVCMRIYGYGVDFGSGDISAHIGIGIYAVFGINGEITITARIESAGTVNGGVTGNLWAVALGVPAAIPYASYDSEKFDVAVKLNAKIHAWAYVGPQVTIDVLDFNLLTVQVWVGVEGDAVINAEASTTGSASFQMDLSLDFVVLFRAWIFNYSYEKYLLKLNIYKNTFQFSTGQSVGADSNKNRDISPNIKVDGCCSYYDMIWGEIYYTDSLGTVNNVTNGRLTVTVTRNGVNSVYNCTTDALGQFCLDVPGGLKPQDEVRIGMHYSETIGEVTSNYNCDLEGKINPTIPFKIYLLEADGFNDDVVGNVSPANPVPGHPDKRYFNGNITVYIVDEEGRSVRTKQVKPVDGRFEAEFPQTMDLSGGHTAFARLTFEGATLESEHMEANLEALKMNVGCFIDGIDAASICEYIAHRDSRYPTFGVNALNIEAAGTITNLDSKEAYNGEVEITIKNLAGAYSKSVPVTVKQAELSIQSQALKDTDLSTDLKDIDVGVDLPDIQIPMSSVSTFEESLGKDMLGPIGSLLMGISFKIEHEGMVKIVSFPLADTDTEGTEAVASNPIDEIMTDVIESRVNWPDVMISVGASQMQVNGIRQDIDGGANTSVQMIQGVVYVPVKAVVEALGGTFSFNSKTRQMNIGLNNTTITATEGKQAVKSGGKTSNMPVAPYIAGSGTVMVPASLLSDKFGLETSWDPKTGTLSITSPDADTSKGQDTKEVKEDKQEDMEDTENTDDTEEVKEDVNDKPEETDNTSKEEPTDNSAEDTSEASSEDSSQESELSGEWNGVWDTEFGTLLLNQKEDKVSGSYGMSGTVYQLTGIVKGSKLTGTFTEASAKGTFEFTLSEEEDSFKGRFRYTGKSWSEWSGTKVSGSFGSTNTDWGGVWYTDLGSMVFEQKGSKVDGIYSSNSYEINGTVTGLNLSGEITYDGLTGEVQLTMEKDKQSFEGKYLYDGDEGYTYFYGYKMR